MTSFIFKSFFLKYFAVMSSKCNTIGRIGDVKNAIRNEERLTFSFLSLMNPDNMMGTIIVMSEHHMT